MRERKIFIYYIVISSNKLKARASHCSRHVLGFYWTAGTVLGFVRDTKGSAMLSFPTLMWQLQTGSVHKKINCILPVSECIELSS
jgi:hypothetical protein